LRQQFGDRLDNHKFYILVVLALPALFDVSRRVGLDRWLGELSYPIYLSHLAVLGCGQVVATVFLGPLENRNWFTLAMLTAVLLVSIAFVQLLDAPFEQWRQRRTIMVRPETAPAALPQPITIPLSA